MRSLGLDIGGKRTGVAISDLQEMLATPLTVLDNEDQDAIVDLVLKLVEQYEADRIVVGLPLSLTGEPGKQAGKVTAFVDRLLLRAKQKNLNELNVQLWDERFSTQAAERLKTEAGGKEGKLRPRARRGARNHSFRPKAGVDAIAAAFVLQSYLDSLRKMEQCPDT
ncbi:MAG: Holliday junction resolvase RuvX [Dehalococcoidia bacterium]